MKRCLIGSAIVAAVVVIALLVRNDLAEHPAEAATPEAVEVAGAPPAAADDMEVGAGDGAGVDARDGAAAPGVAADREPAAADPDAADSAGADANAADPNAANAGAAAADPDPAARGRTGAAERGAGVSAQDPDAEAVLRRASAAYEAVRSLRADFVQVAENPLLRNRVTSRGTLYQRRPDRFLMKFSEPAGDVIVSDGRSIWIYYPSVDDDQVIRAPAGAGGAGGVDLQAQFLGDPLTRFSPRLEGREEVNGRAAYVLTLAPRRPTGYRSLKVWVDARDHLVRRFELVEENGVSRRFELAGLRVDPTLPDSLFRFTPPAGARVVERG